MVLSSATTKVDKQSPNVRRYRGSALGYLDSSSGSGPSAPSSAFATSSSGFFLSPATTPFPVSPTPLGPSCASTAFPWSPSTTSRLSLSSRIFLSSTAPFSPSSTFSDRACDGVEARDSVVAAGFVSEASLDAVEGGLLAAEPRRNVGALNFILPG